MASAGDVIGGKYRLVHPLGTGGMGAVWRAEHTALMQQVAIKLLDARGPAADRAVKRFQREAQIAAGIRHRNIVYISDFGTDGGAPYLVMELLTGVPLSERMVVGEPLGVVAFLRIMLETLDGLSAVHAAGVVHRDMKPENIFLVGTGPNVLPKLLDFGVSRSVDRTQGHTITREGIVMGTPEYVSPEQARGRMADTRSDLYSLGVVMYEALSGRLPFQADNSADLIVDVLNATMTPLFTLRPDLGEELSDVVSRAMTRNPTERFQTTDEMREAISAVLAARPTLHQLRLPRRYQLPAAPTTTPMSTSMQVVQPEPHGLRATQPERVSGEPETFRDVWGRSRKRVTAAWGLGTAAFISGLAALGFYLSYEPNSQAHAAAEGQPGSVEVVPAQPALPAQSEVAVELFGIPPGAQAFVDGHPVAGSTVRLARDSGMHAISVRAEGREPWMVMHDAAVGGRYALALQPSQPGATTVQAMAKKPERSQRSERSRSQRRSEKKSDEKFLRTPDF